MSASEAHALFTASRPKNARAVSLVRLGFAARARHRLQHLGEECRLVPARSRARGQCARQEERRVGLDHQASFGDLPQETQEVTPPPLVGDPAGDPDVEIEREVGVELGFATREAMHDGFREPRAVTPEELGSAMTGAGSGTSTSSSLAASGAWRTVRITLAMSTNNPET